MRLTRPLDSWLVGCSVAKGKEGVTRRGKGEEDVAVRTGTGTGEMSGHGCVAEAFP